MYRWIKAQLPIEKDWESIFYEQVTPLFQPAANTGVFSRWFFDLDYNRGPIIVLYLHVDASVLHSIVRPLLSDCFGKIKPKDHPDPFLNQLSSSFRLEPLDELNELEANIHVKSTSLFSEREIVLQSKLVKCLIEVLNALDVYFENKPDEDAEHYLKNKFGRWLDQYLMNRYLPNQVQDRYAQETEVYQFLKTQKLNLGLPLDPKQKAWVELFAELKSIGQFDRCIQMHLARYQFSSFQIGKLWLNAVMRKYPSLVNCQDTTVISH